MLLCQNLTAPYIQALQGYNDIGEVPEEIGTKLQNVSTAITSIADIIKALKEVEVDDENQQD